ncbi:MAG: 3-phosphoshikimate 1-carboxyvinyltransferase [Actinobacteria bacterium]|nr:3-phosphoshikimate 1-carboxyvinyltransferase [Actinomycetota bacterium]NCV41772.1 3-phosphoshikimate 1-carboxyvinyltransferase [Actinomycetota bacterium]NCV82205.1 3-phosphoshikimate 1-carboxyvinyltransferase [Actinomycetota bacterium]NCW42606.1 3-phosphoshikimate 1-carboxyvinyltransferase [Actinomycetota bacterium]NCW71477.1 3-phosphoshikimate 1-carboxyvinyltransferase [Actinomycetota bacterium]
MNNNAHWPALFRGAQPVEAFVVIPGSKSVTNRALILAAQADSSSILHRPLVSRDSELMVAGLRALGVGIEEKNVTTNGVEELQWIITPAPLRGGVKIDVGNAGTVMRFLPPLAALATGDVAFDGDPRSYERPLGPVIRALEELGISTEHDGRYSLPLKLHGIGKIPGGALTIDASASSQFLSALLLVAPSFENGIVATHKGGQLPSMPHIEMTVDMLRSFGADVEVDTAAQSWSVKAGKLHGQELVIEPDLSNAAPFLSLAMVCGGSITIADWPKTTTQPGDQLRSIFTRMGAKVSMNERGLTLSGTGVIHGIDIDLHDVGELTPSIAAVAALADSPSHLRGIAHLRLHETDRLSALTREINALGGDVVEEESALHITPAPLHGGVFHTYDDHRLATAGAVIGLVVPGIEVENIATTRKTLPDFPGLWSSLLA